MMFQKLADARLLWSLFVVCVVLTISFVVISQVFGFRFLDGMWVPGEVLAQVGVMTDTQKAVHSLSTLTLDVLYPMTYGALFLGLVVRYFHDPHPVLFLPALLVVPVDVVEGVVQVFILNGGIGLVGTKYWLTVSKFLLFLLAFGLAMFAMGRVIVQSLRQKFLG